jgi:hypothetical protein
MPTPTKSNHTERAIRTIETNATLTSKHEDVEINCHIVKAKRKINLEGQ